MTPTFPTAHPQAAAQTERRPVLTQRQLEILGWVQEGKSARDIGAILGISGRTVEGHIRVLRKRMDVTTKIQVVVKARALGLLDTTE